MSNGIGMTLGATAPGDGRATRSDLLTGRTPRGRRSAPGYFAQSGGPAFTKPEHILALKLTYWPTPEEISLADQLGFDGYLERHLNPDAIDDSACDALLTPYTTLTMDQPTLIKQNPTTVIEEWIIMQFLRATYSKRQLLERMNEFWRDHFNVFAGGSDAVLRSYNERSVYRPHALGNFKAFLHATSKMPSMIRYLNLDQNFHTGINENYPREMLELHTCGRNGGYTEQDVREIARCMTGWHLKYNFDTRHGSLNGTFFYESKWHDTGTKTVFGNTIPFSGIPEGERCIDLAFARPATAPRICTKLFGWFIGRPPTSSELQRMTTAWGTNGDIKAVLRAILTRETLLSAGFKMKRPWHFYISAMRAIGATAVNPMSNIRMNLRYMGNNPGQWLLPDGYPDTADFWKPGILLRGNSAVSLAYNQWGITNYNLTNVIGSSTSVSSVVESINQRIFLGAMNSEVRNALTAHLTASNTDVRRKECVAFALSSAQFQWF